MPLEGHRQLLHRDVGGKENSDAAWFYPETKDAAARIKGYLAFWHGVEVQAAAGGAARKGVLGALLRR